MTVEAGWLLRACDGSGWLALYGRNRLPLMIPGHSLSFNPPSRRVYNSKLQVNRPKSLSCIISSLAADLRDSSYRAAEQLSSPAAEQAAAGKVRACRSGASPHLAGYLGQVDVLT
jgi:hypothetical protein